MTPAVKSSRYVIYSGNGVLGNWVDVERYRLFAVHGVEPQAPVVLGQRLQRVRHDEPIPWNDVEAEPLFYRV